MHMSPPESFSTTTRHSIPPFAALRAFESFARLGGVRKAAIALEIDHSAVSRHLKSLQNWLGVELIAKEGGGQHLTVAGETYYQEVSGAFKHLVDATLSLQGAERANFSVCCSPGLGAKWLARHIAGFQNLAPGTEIDMRSTDEPVDFSRQNVSGDIRYITHLDTVRGKGLRYLEFANPLVYPVASPLYLAQHGAIRTIEELKSAELLHEYNADDWLQWFAVMGHPCQGRLLGHRLWHAHVTIEAAIHGRGIVLANDLLVKDDLLAGTLVKVTIDDTNSAPEASLGSYYFISTEARWTNPIVRTFRRWLQEEVRIALE